MLRIVVECSPMGLETGVQSQVGSYQRLKKWYLIPPCLKLSIVKACFKGKVEQSRERNSALPTPRCSSYWKGSFQVALEYCRQQQHIYKASASVGSKRSEYLMPQNHFIFFTLTRSSSSQMYSLIIYISWSLADGKDFTDFLSPSFPSFHRSKHVF